MLRREICEPPFVEAPAMLAFSIPMLLPPWICGTVFRSTSKTLVSTPDIWIAETSITWTGIALFSSAAAGM